VGIPVRRSASEHKDHDSPSWNESDKLSADKSRSNSNNDISKENDPNQLRKRGFSDISAEQVKLPLVPIIKERSMSKNDLMDERSPMTSPPFALEPNSPIQN